MSGYLDFNGADCAPVDKIAEALNSAGRSYHHTEQWHDDDVLEKSCADSIQEALDSAAMNFKSLERECAELRKQCSLLRQQRDAWKTEAEHQYGLLRAEILDEPDYPVTGALDAYAAGRHPVLKAEPPL